MTAELETQGLKIWGGKNGKHLKNLLSWKVDYIKHFLEPPELPSIYKKARKWWNFGSLFIETHRTCR